MSERKPYGYCCVPRCESTSRKTPEKYFFAMPNDPDWRRQCYDAARRQHIPSEIGCSRIFEDHFNVCHFCFSKKFSFHYSFYCLFAAHCQYFVCALIHTHLTRNVTLKLQMYHSDLIYVGFNDYFVCIYCIFAPVFTLCFYLAH